MTQDTPLQPDAPEPSRPTSVLLVEGEQQELARMWEVLTGAELRVRIGAVPSLDGHPYGLFAAESGVLLYASQRWEELTGLPLADVVGRPLSAFLQVPPRAWKQSGRLEQAQLVGVSGRRYVRVVWSTEGDVVVGSVEPITALYVEQFKAETRLTQFTEILNGVVQAFGTLAGQDAGHVLRVCELAVRLGEALHLGERDLQYLRWGAHLHDIGKSRVPPGIINKPGALSTEERAVVNTHPELGVALLENVPFPQAVTDIVRHHHERWDGGGYPRQLSGEDIPLLARIVAVADVFDALTSERPYREAWHPMSAADYLLAERGRMFTPGLVDVFVKRVLPAAVRH